MKRRSFFAALTGVVAILPRAIRAQWNPNPNPKAASYPLAFYKDAISGKWAKHHGCVPELYSKIDFNGKKWLVVGQTIRMTNGGKFADLDLAIFTALVTAERPGLMESKEEARITIRIA